MKSGGCLQLPGRKAQWAAGCPPNQGLLPEPVRGAAGFCVSTQPCRGLSPGQSRASNQARPRAPKENMLVLRGGSWGIEILFSKAVPTKVDVCISQLGWIRVTSISGVGVGELPTQARTCPKRSIWLVRTQRWPLSYCPLTWPLLCASQRGCALLWLSVCGWRPPPMVSLNSHFFHVSPDTATLRHVKDKRSLMKRHSLDS